MRKKKMKKFIYEGLGFPVILRNVSVIEMQGEEVLDIDFNALQKIVLLSLCHKDIPLTGTNTPSSLKFLSFLLREVGVIVLSSVSCFALREASWTYASSIMRIIFAVWEVDRPN